MMAAPPASAAHCPIDYKKIAAALEDKQSLKAKGVMENDAMTLHGEAKKGLAMQKAGKHGDSIKTLHGAMEKLGISH
jgi:hypothetical protein